MLVSDYIRGRKTNEYDARRAARTIEEGNHIQNIRATRVAPGEENRCSERMCLLSGGEHPFGTSMPLTLGSPAYSP